MKRAVIYARVSTERQAEEGLSVESQIDACRKKADELGAAVLHVYTDEGISGTTDARPGFRAAINHCTMTGADYMLVWSSSRFARDQHDAITYKRELATNGVRLVYANSGLDLGTNEGWLTDSFQQIIDEHYSRQVSSDTKRSMIKAARDGFFMGGRVPYGYDAVPAPDSKRRRLQAQPEQAAVVQMMFERSARRIGAFAIAVMLNEQGITMRGRPWNKNTVLNMLKSEVYMGQVIYNRFDRKTRRERPKNEWVKVQAHEPLVSADRFDDVQRGIANRAPGEGAAAGNTQHAFSGLLRCGACGGGLKLSNGRGRNGTVYYYYACNAGLQGRRSNLYEVLEAAGKDAPGINELGPRLRELNEQIKRIELSLVALEDEAPPLFDPLGVSATDAAGLMREMVTRCEDAKTLRDFVASIVEKIVVEGSQVRVDYHPECLIRNEGAMVHSTRNWLPVLAKLRTATVVIQRPGCRVLRLRRAA